MLGFGELGTLAFGQLPENDGLAQGVTLDVAAQLIAGVASVETGTIRFVGGSAFTSRPHTAQGATVVVGTSIIPGKAQAGHEIVFKDQHGRTTRTLVIFGATDEELTDDDFMMGLMFDDWDPWLLRQREAA